MRPVDCLRHAGRALGNLHLVVLQPSGTTPCAGSQSAGPLSFQDHNRTQSSRQHLVGCRPATGHVATCKQTHHTCELIRRPIPCQTSSQTDCEGALCAGRVHWGLLYHCDNLARSVFHSHFAAAPAHIHAGRAFECTTQAQSRAF